MKARRKVLAVPQNAAVRVGADGNRRISLEACLAWSSRVGTQGALLPALRSA